MIVYGDQPRLVSSAAQLRALHELLTHICGSPANDAQFEQLLIGAGQLWQSLADADFHARGHDCSSRIDAACARTVRTAAAIYLRRFLPGRADPPLELLARRCRKLLDRLDAAALVGVAPVRPCEGFLHYALYPEQYALAARRLAALSAGPFVVVGLRSIGTALAAIVAERLRAAWLLSVRPAGHPYRRELALGPLLAERLRRFKDRRADFIVVDEGPGRSGSSLAAAVTALHRCGIAHDHIWLMPGHAGEPGPAADEPLRRCWRAARRLVATFEPIPVGRELGGGLWRSELRATSAALDALPPCGRSWERRKVLLQDRSGGPVLAKFAGLGAQGERKLERARALAAAGLGPRPLGLQHGYLLMEWHSAAHYVAEPATLPAGQRRRLLQFAARYLADVAATQPPVDGAALHILLENALANLGQADADLAGAARERAAQQRISDGCSPAAGPRVWSDGRMHAWEWLRLPDGRFLKADALDHCLGHDYVGAQSLDWDLVGAVIELELTSVEQAELEHTVAAAGRWRPQPGASTLFHICYTGFQVGYFGMAAETEASSAERARLRSQVMRYCSRLQVELARS